MIMPHDALPRKTEASINHITSNFFYLFCSFLRNISPRIEHTVQLVGSLIFCGLRTLFLTPSQTPDIFLRQIFKFTNRKSSAILLYINGSKDLFTTSQTSFTLRIEHFFSEDNTKIIKSDTSIFYKFFILSYLVFFHIASYTKYRYTYYAEVN